ncbi:MAG: peptide-methionine (S)-S-oxide reductase MsrA [Candidatus Natronoplasma sp.]
MIKEGGLLVGRSGRDGSKLITGKIPGLDRDVPEVTGRATFSMGCFWGPDALFGSLAGVVSTIVGYAGGDTKDPNYRNLGDHTETVMVEYDPEKIEYRQLLKLFWKNHDASRERMTQYRSMIFVHGREQAELARRTKDGYPGEAKTLIRNYSEFYPAEDYHQKYKLSQHRLIYDAFKSIYPEMEDFVSSTAVARANGYVAGHGAVDSLEGLGLNERGRELVYKAWKRARGG